MSNKRFLQKKGFSKLELQSEHGVLLGVNESSHQLIIGTDKGVIKAAEFRHKGSEEERWNFEEVNKIQGLPWQPDPNTAGMEVKPRVFLPMEAPPTGEGGVNKAHDRERCCH